MGRSQRATAIGTAPRAVNQRSAAASDAGINACGRGPVSLVTANYLEPQYVRETMARGETRCARRHDTAEQTEQPTADKCRYAPRSLLGIQTMSAAALTLVSAAVSGITIRWVFTESTSARMLRSPAATNWSILPTNEVRYTPAR